MGEEETFWVVQQRYDKDREWRYARWSLHYWRYSAISSYLRNAGWVESWENERRRGLVRCIKVRIVPVNMPDSGGMGG